MKLAPLLVLSLVVTETAQAHGTFETYGTDPRSMAMGNAVVAGGEGFSTAHTNPANLTKSKRPELGAGFVLAVPHVSFDAESPRAEGDPLALAEPPPYSGFAMGFATPVNFIVDDRLFIGVAGYVPSFALVKARGHDPARPFFSLYDSATDHYEVAFAAAVRVFDWLHVGGGMRVGAGQRGTVDIDVDVVRRRVTNQSIDSEQFPSFSPEAGITVGPLGVPSLVQVSAGFAWREPTQFPVVLPASLGFDGLDIETELPILIVANFSPRTFVGGVTVDVEAFPAAKTRLSLDAVYGMWSEAPAPFLVTSLKLAGAGVSRLGVDGALDAPAEGQERAIAPGFRDTVSVRGGVEVKVLDDKLALRGGYQYRPSPVPDQTSGTNIIDPNAHIASVGLGVKVTLPWGLLAHPFDVDFAYQAQIFAPRTAVKESSDDPVGNWTASGAVSAGSIGVRYAF